jgi:unsaturated rhamnogalacturonyl hydrolase
LHPNTPSGEFSKSTALAWFEAQYKITEGKGAAKNINTMAPFYCLAGFLYDGSVKDERWLAWCDEWAEWIIHELPREFHTSGCKGLC